ncbi:DUF3566 domain-containing protein [Haloglycomyces albus]|uniref:DUF3566 domain-containing protein n=1 Tax=Haloglycomyces albus TaxID=526067 RepID=UPI00046D32DF|nr:DUF3566 domain-containing protein [Haloglycomyces albus]
MTDARATAGTEREEERPVGAESQQAPEEKATSDNSTDDSVGEVTDTEESAVGGASASDGDSATPPHQGVDAVESFAPEDSSSSDGGSTHVPDETVTFNRPEGMTPPPTEPEEPAPGAVPPAGPTSSARVADAVRAARAAVSQATGRGPRRARLRVKRVDPWSVMKFSFALSVVMFIVIVVATTVLYITLDAMGVFATINDMISTFMSTSGTDEESDPFRVTAKGVIGVAAVLGVVNMVLFTALATLGAFIYNVCSDLVGGIEVTLAEKD